MQALCSWLQKKYDVQKFGPPTWRMLVRAVVEDAGGKSPTLAEQIATKHPCELELLPCKQVNSDDWGDHSNQVLTISHIILAHNKHVMPMGLVITFMYHAHR